MTRKEKAKAYDEALERARKQRDDYQKELNKADKNSQLAGLLRAGISAIELAFPELAESEDEKTRKELLEEIESIIPHEDETDSEGLILPSYHTRIDRYKSYLERQKEHKPVISDDAIREGVAHFGITQYQIDNWLKKHINVIEQKPEWGEEDYKMLENIRYALRYAYFNSVIDEQTTEYAMDWLKSLPERFVLQPKQEWSKEDKGILNELLDHCNTENATWYNWLKSLRPQPHWKPSEEHFQGLRRAITKADEGSDAERDLKDLYEQLKKL